MQCELRVQYESSLIKALKTMGYSPNIFEQAKNLFGYEGSARIQKAHIIIPKKQVGTASNDIGFFREASGFYTMHVSEFDKNNWNEKLPELIKNYTSNVVNDIVQSGPYQWDNQTVDENGVTTIRLIVRE